MVQPAVGPAAAALAHFLQASDPVLPKQTISEGSLLVDRDYRSDKGAILSSTLKVDRSAGFSVPEDLRKDLMWRTGRETITARSTVGPFIRLLDFETVPFPKTVGEFAKVFPDAKSWVTLWPTGLSADRTRALVIFRYGVPEPAQRAVYLLEIRDGAWKVVHHSFPPSR